MEFRGDVREKSVDRGLPPCGRRVADACGRPAAYHPAERRVCVVQEHAVEAAGLRLSAHPGGPRILIPRVADVHHARGRVVLEDERVPVCVSEEPAGVVRLGVGISDPVRDAARIAGSAAHQVHIHQDLEVVVASLQPGNHWPVALLHDHDSVPRALPSRRQPRLAVSVDRPEKGSTKRLGDADGARASGRNAGIVFSAVACRRAGQPNRPRDGRERNGSQDAVPEWREWRFSERGVRSSRQGVPGRWTVCRIRRRIVDWFGSGRTACSLRERAL